MPIKLFWASIADLSILFPGALLCFLPMKDCLCCSVRKTGLWTLGVLSVCILASALLRSYFDIGRNTMLLTIMPVCFLMYLRALTTPWYKALFAFLISTGSMACAILLSVLMGPERENEASLAGLLTAPAVVLASVLCLLSWDVLTKRVNWLMRNFHVKRVWYVVWLLPACYTALMMFCVPLDHSIVSFGRVRMVSSLVAVVLFLMVVSFLYFFYFLANTIMERMTLEQENQLLAIQGDRLHQLNAYIAQTRTLRHDFRQHIRVMSNLASTERFGELREYLKDYENTLPSQTEQLCANVAVDALAAYYELQAKTLGIRTDWHLDLCREIPLPEVDLCIILGNLLENAIRGAACMPPDQRSMAMTCRMLTEGTLGVNIVNTYLPGAKAARTGEGIGLKSVTAMVKKYQGAIDIDAGEQEYHIRLVLNLPV